MLGTDAEKLWKLRVLGDERHNGRICVWPGKSARLEAELWQQVLRRVTALSMPDSEKEALVSPELLMDMARSIEALEALHSHGLAISWKGDKDLGIHILECALEGTCPATLPAAGSDITLSWMAMSLQSSSQVPRSERSTRCWTPTRASSRPWQLRACVLTWIHARAENM